jgi:hypothetical protein
MYRKFRLQRQPQQMVAVNIQHIQAWATDKMMSYSLEVGQGLVTPYCKQSACYRISLTASDRSFIMTQTTENEHQIWRLECVEFL